MSAERTGAAGPEQPDEAVDPNEPNELMESDASDDGRRSADWSTAADATPQSGPAIPAESAEPATEPATEATTPLASGPQQPVATPGGRPVDSRARPRTGPIVWGVIVLAFCVYTAFQVLAPGSVDATVFVIAAVIGLGVLLLAVGVAVVLRASRSDRR